MGLGGDSQLRSRSTEISEVEPILLNEFVKVTLGQLDSDKFADDTAKQIQAIMDKPGV